MKYVRKNIDSAITWQQLQTLEKSQVHSQVHPSENYQKHIISYHSHHYII